MIVRIQVSESVAFASVYLWIKNKKGKIKSYPAFKDAVQYYIERYGNFHSASRNIIDYLDPKEQEIYNQARTITDKYYNNTKGGKKMSNSEVLEDQKPVVNGGEETADQEAVKPTADEVTTADTSETKPIND